MSVGNRERNRRRRLLYLLVLPGVVLFVVANAHLVHVALTSEPDCVAHLKTKGRDGVYRAAQPSC